MENRITGMRPQPITEDEVNLSENQAAIELCEQVKLLTAEARESLLQQALTVSNEKCNSLVERLNAQVEELTQQVKNVRWLNSELATRLKEDAEKLLKDLKDNNYHLSESLKITLRRITEVATQIQTELTIAMAKATERVCENLERKINQVADIAVIKMEERTKEIEKKLRATEQEIDKVKKQIYYESGFRKFFFWATPVLLLAQTVMLILMSL